MAQETVQTSAPAKEMGVLQRIIGVFTSPRQTFESVDRKPDWLVPFVIILVVSLAFTLALRPIMLEEQFEKQREAMLERGMSESQVDEQLQKGQKIAQITAPIGALVASALSLLIVAAVLLFCGNVVMGGEAKFKKVFAVNTWASLIGVLGIIIKAPFIWQKQTIQIHFGLAAFLSEDQAKTFLYKVFANVELFTIWGLIVLGIGLAVIYKWTTQRALTLVFVLWLIYVFGSAGLASLF